MEVFAGINSIVWGLPTVILIALAGIYLTHATGAAQLRLLPKSVAMLIQNIGKKGESTSLRALCTALAATVGTGNIAGVAGAIAIGGAGSIFWMWICAFLGMIIKFAEALLAVKYRINNGEGEYRGGPMYIITGGLGKKWHPMAAAYCLFGAVAAFGIGGAAQINAVATSVEEAVGVLGGEVAKESGVGIAVLVVMASTVTLLGGMKRIGSLNEMLVPISAISYCVLCIGALIQHYQAIPFAMQQILHGAFSPQAVTGGAVGSFFLVIRTGAARGTFTNEAGLGTAGIAHGTAAVDHPAEQGLMGIIEVFLDTIVICTLTAVVILTSGTEIHYGIDEGAILTTRAMACTYGKWITIPMAIFLAAFAFATMIGWGFYGQCCVAYLFGTRAEKTYTVLFTAVTLASLFASTGNIWILSELANGIMVIPNLVAILSLAKDVAEDTQSFIQAGHLRQASERIPPKGSRWRRVRSRGHESQESFHR